MAVFYQICSALILTLAWNCDPAQGTVECYGAAANAICELATSGDYANDCNGGATLPGCGICVSYIDSSAAGTATETGRMCSTQSTCDDAKQDLVVAGKTLTNLDVLCCSAALCNSNLPSPNGECTDYCHTCYADGTCALCMEGYMVNAYGFCVACPDYCSECIPSDCQQCEDGYTDQGDGTCDVAPIRVMDDTFAISESLSETLSALPQETQEDLGYSASEFLVECQYKGEPCYEADFHRWVHPLYGNCYTFNSGWEAGSAIDKSYRTGSKFGFDLVLNLGTVEYLEAIDNAEGARIIIHDQKRKPFPDEEGFLGRPGTLVSMAITKERIKRLSSPYGDCVKDGSKEAEKDVNTQFYNVGYSQMGCAQTCYQRNVIERCGCYDAAYTKNTNAPVCRMSDNVQENCRYQVQMDFANGRLGCNDECPQPCDESYYEVKATSAEWPSEAYHDRAVQKLASKIQDLVNVSEPGAFEKNLVVVRVYYETFNYREIEEYPAYPGLMFASDLGGILGFWLGCSMITIFEFFIFFGTLVLACRGKNDQDGDEKVKEGDSSPGQEERGTSEGPGAPKG